MRPITLRHLILDYRSGGMWHLAPVTARNYGEHLGWWERLCGDRHAERIEQSEILRRIAEMDYGPGYVSLRHRVRILNRVYKYGIERGLVKTNPCAGVVMRND